MSAQAFIPLPTSEDAETGIPEYSPTGPGFSGMPADGSRPNHLFFGHCCDCRRAVLVVNGITITLNILSMIIVAIGFGFINKNVDDIEADMSDDAAKKELDEFVKGGNLAIVETLLEFFVAISIGLHACGVYGALKFKQWGVMTAAVAYGLALFLNLLAFNILDIILAGVFLYPHIYLIKEMKEGIMTDYNYHNVASCCGSRNM